MKRLGVVLSSLALLAACGQTPGVAVDGPPPTSVPSLGLEPVQFNEADDACVDFYRSAAESHEEEHRYIRRLADRVDSAGHQEAAAILDDLADQWEVGIWEADHDEVWQSGQWAHAGRLLADGGAVRCTDLAEWWGIDGYEGERDPGEMLRRQARIWESGRPDDYHLLVAASRASSMPTQVYARVVGDEVAELRLVESGSVELEAMPLSVDEMYLRLLEGEHRVDRYDLVTSAPAVFALGEVRFIVVVDLDRFPTPIDTDAVEQAGSSPPEGPTPADMDPDHEQILLDVVEPQPGEAIAATFSETNSRGGYFFLFQWDGSDWGEPVYLLESDANGRQPSAIRISDGVGMDDYGVGGPGPDRLVLPADLEPGHWWLCTANARDRACAPVITIGDAGG